MEEAAVKPIQAFSSQRGFSLIELVLACALGAAFSGLMIQALLADAQSGQSLAQRLRQRTLQRRTLALIKSDLQQSDLVEQDPRPELSSCNLSGRVPVLQLQTKAGVITYSIGAPPSSIWRRQVLLRCGPAFGLDGSLSLGGAAQNRVVLDNLPEVTDAPLRIERQPEQGLLHVQLIASRMDVELP